MKEIIGIGILLLILGLQFMLIYAMCEPVQYTPMSPEEEIDWLMKDCGLSREEAEEIANI